MQELAKIIVDKARRDGSLVGQATWVCEELKEAAEKWALHALSLYQGPVLTRALAISQALAEFDNELRGKGT